MQQLISACVILGIVWTIVCFFFYRSEWKKANQGTTAMYLLLLHNPNATGKEVSAAYYEAHNMSKKEFEGRLRTPPPR